MRFKLVAISRMKLHNTGLHQNALDLCASKISPHNLGKLHSLEAVIVDSLRLERFTLS